MRWLMLLFTVIFSFSLHAERMGLLLTWSQFSALSPQKRMEYLADLRELVATMESAQEKYEVADNSLSEMKDYVAQLQRWTQVLPVANADSNVVPRWDKEEFEKSAMGWKCPGDNSVFDQRLGTCVVTQSWWGAEERTFSSAVLCPKASVAVKGYDEHSDQFMCIPKESWATLKPERQTAILNGNFYESEAFKGRPYRGGDPYAVLDLSAEKSPSPEVESYVKSKLPAKIAAGEADGRPSFDMGTPIPGPAPAPFKSGAPAEEPAVVKEAPAVPPAPSTENSDSVETCKPQKLNCSKWKSQKERADLIKKFRQNHDPASNVCIYGGYSSKYQTNLKKKGTCVPQNRFPDGEKDKKAIKCEGRTVLCNPALFCIGLARGEAVVPASICVPRGASATQKCLEGFESRREGKVPLDKRYPNEKPQLCDPTTVKLPSNWPVKEEWNALAQGIEGKYKSFCLGDKGFEALFCNECNIIAERIQKMNMNVRAKECRATVKATGESNSTGDAKSEGSR